MRTFRAAISSLLRRVGHRTPEDRTGRGEPTRSDSSLVQAQNDGPDSTICPLCEARPSEPQRPLCVQCRREQRRLFWMEAFGGGFFFLAVAAFLYLVGRWYVG